MQYRLGIDIGGTFTDFVAFDEANRELKAWKNLSTPHDPIEGVMTGLKTFGDTDKHRCDPPRYDGRDQRAARRQRRGGRYLTTRGFRDVPFIGRGNRRNHYDLAWVKPKPFVKRRNAFEVNERIGPSGGVIEKLDEAQVRAMADDDCRRMARSKSVAVVLMHSYLAPEHEFLIKKIFAERAPEHSGLDLLRGAAEVEGAFPLLDHDLRRLHQAGRKPAAPLDPRASARAKMSAPKSSSCAQTAAR